MKKFQEYDHCCYLFFNYHDAFQNQNTAQCRKRNTFLICGYALYPLVVVLLANSPVKATVSIATRAGVLRRWYHQQLTTSRTPRRLRRRGRRQAILLLLLLPRFCLSYFLGLRTSRRCILSAPASFMSSSALCCTTSTITF